MKRLVGLLDSYIELLQDELNEVVTYAESHGWKSTRYEEGVALRKEIKEERTAIKLRNPIRKVD